MLTNNPQATASTQSTAVPDGFMQNAKGHLVPISKVKEIDKLRDEQVRKIAQTALKLNEQMATIKAEMFADFNDFVALSASEYDTKLGGEKGNVTILSYDGSTKVQLAVSENIVFDERLQVAKTLIDECLHEWTEDSNDNIKAIINQAFQVDKEGKISTHRVMGLRSLDITDGKWLKAMQAIQDAVKVTSTKEYLRIYQRDEHGKYHQVILDFSAV